MQIQQLLAGVALAFTMSVAHATTLLVGVDPVTGESKFYIASGVGKVNKSSDTGESGTTLNPNQQSNLSSGDAPSAPYVPNAEIDDLISNTSNAIIEAFIASKAAMDQENAAYMDKLQSESSGQEANQEAIDRINQNLNNLVGNIVKNAISQGKVSEEQLQGVIAKINEQLDKKLDLDNAKSPELSEQEKFKQAQIKLLEAERKKKQEAQKSKQDELKKQNEELQAKLKEQLEKQKAEKLKAQEAAKKKAEEEFAKKLANDAAKKAFEAKQKALADEKEKQKQALAAKQEEEARKSAASTPPQSSPDPQQTAGTEDTQSRTPSDEDSTAVSGSGNAGQSGDQAGQGGAAGAGGGAVAGAGGQAGQGPAGSAGDGRGGAGGDGGQGGLAGHGGDGGAGGQAALGGQPGSGGGQGGAGGDGGAGGQVALGGQPGPGAGQGGAGGDGGAGGQAALGGQPGPGAGQGGAGGDGGAGGQVALGGQPGPSAGQGGAGGAGGDGGGPAPQASGPTGDGGAGGNPGGLDPKYLDLVGKNKLNQSQQQLAETIARLQGGLRIQTNTADAPGAQGDLLGRIQALIDFLRQLKEEETNHMRAAYTPPSGGSPGAGNQAGGAGGRYDPNAPVDAALLRQLVNDGTLPPLSLLSLAELLREAMAGQPDQGNPQSNGDSAADDASQDKLLRDFVESVIAASDYPYIAAGDISELPPTRSLTGAMTATYNGRMSGAFTDSVQVNGAMSLNVDFREHLVTGTIDFGSNGIAAVGGEYPRTENRLGIPFHGDVFGGSGHGQLRGSFYGPKGQELGGDWDMHVNDGSPDGRNAEGRFATKQ